MFLQFGQPYRAQGRAQGWPSRAPGRPRELVSRPRLGSRLAASATMPAPCAGQAGLGWGQGWALYAKGFQASLGAGLQARKAGFSAQVKKTLKMASKWKGGINSPSPTLERAPRPEQEHLHCCNSSNHIDLPIPPPKLIDLWRIEGEGLDLLFHQTIPPLSEGNLVDHDLGVSLCLSFVLPLKSLPSISCFGWISERRT